MLFLRREYIDSSQHAELVLLHATLRSTGVAEADAFRCTRVAVPSGPPGRRVAYVPVPEPREGDRVVVRYRFSVVGGGVESYSPFYEAAVPSDDVISDLYRVPEEGTGNLTPAAGRGYFRLPLPLEEGELPSGVFRYGFGAMRKKPSPELCRASVDAGNGPAPIVEIPEALSVLKGRPMPYFLYHFSGNGPLQAVKIACARVTLADEAGEVISARLLWGDQAWRASNFSSMEAKGFPEGPGAAAEEFFAKDRDAWLAARWAGLSRKKAPRVFEAYVFGPSGCVVEYCCQVVLRRPDGALSAQWRNPGIGKNWTVTI